MPLSTFVGFSGTLSSTLGNKFGFRPVIMVATILCSTGFVTSAFVPRIEVLYLTIGILTGEFDGLTVYPVYIYTQKK